MIWSWCAPPPRGSRRSWAGSSTARCRPSVGLSVAAPWCAPTRVRSTRRSRRSSRVRGNWLRRSWADDRGPRIRVGPTDHKSRSSFGASLRAAARFRSRAPLGPRVRPHRAGDRGDRAAGRGRRGLSRQRRPRPRSGPRRGRRLPRPAHTLDAARRDGGDRPRHHCPRDRLVLPYPRRRRPARAGDRRTRPAARRDAPRGRWAPALDRRRAAGCGVGKSSLLGMIARSTTADVNVIALVGERGREVREFIERDLGDALSRSVVIVATSDQPALVRIKAAFTATAIAEHFRDQGNDVMLMMDSVTRFAMAQREVGLAIGEPPATRGYTPSVFAQLPKLLERSGTAPRGTITGLYTVLVDGDDMNEPIADAVRSILDGHVVLSRDLAHAGHYPAVDVLASVSRLVGEVVTPAVRSAGDEVRRLMAAYRDNADLISIGAYARGSDPVIDAAIDSRGPIDGFLKQGVTELSTADEADSALTNLALLAGVPEPAAPPEPV